MMCVSTQTRSRLILIQVSRFASHLNPGSISTPSCYGDVRLTSINFPSHLHPRRLTYMRVMLNLNTCPDICISHPSKWRLISIQVLKMSSQLHPGPISNTSRPGDVHLNSIQVLCHLHHVSPPYKPRFTSTHVLIIASHIHPGPENFIPTPS